MTKFARNVSAREVGEYEFCSVAWFLDITGHGNRALRSEENLGTRVVEDRRRYQNSGTDSYVVKGLIAVILVLLAFLVAMVV